MVLKNILPSQKNSYNASSEAAQTTHSAMGTVMSHKAFGWQAEECLAAVRSEVKRIEGLLSHFLPASEISRINASAGKNREKVSRETFEVLARAAEFSSTCPGCFDVTIGPLVNLWSNARNNCTLPDERSIHTACLLVDYNDLILDSSDRYDRTAMLRTAGQSLDLGGIGKGLAGDRITEIYRQYSITSACSNLGGNVVTAGSKPDGSPWQIGVQHPRQEAKIIGAVSVVNQSVVTSGDYQRYFLDQQGNRIHHILNPITGYPAKSGLISVSIIADESLAADALSTIVFIAGIEKGIQFLSQFPQIEAVLIDSDMHVYLSQGLRYRFQADQGIDVTVLD